MNFASDNAVPVAPAVMDAILEANAGSAPSYGADGWTARAEAAMAEVFEHEVAAFLVPTGTAANALAIAHLTPPWGAVFAHHGAHVLEDECNAPAFFSGGAQFIALAGEAGKIAPETLTAELARIGGRSQHRSRPACLTLTQATEAGTVYTRDQTAALAELAHAHGMGVHMDGARLANALVHLGCSPAEATWRAGVDVLSLGATKNGALMAEAVIFFNPAEAEDFVLRRKRAGHLLSKHRFAAAQFLALLTDGLWLDLAGRANAAATRLGAGLAALPGCRLAHPVEANEVFVHLPVALMERLLAGGAVFYPWRPEAPDGTRLARFVTAWSTEPSEVESLLNLGRS